MVCAIDWLEVMLRSQDDISASATKVKIIFITWVAVYKKKNKHFKNLIRIIYKQIFKKVWTTVFSEKGDSLLHVSKEPMRRRNHF